MIAQIISISRPSHIFILIKINVMSGEHLHNLLITFERRTCVRSRLRQENTSIVLSTFVVIYNEIFVLDGNDCFSLAFLANFFLLLATSAMLFVVVVVVFQFSIRPFGNDMVPFIRECTWVAHKNLPCHVINVPHLNLWKFNFINHSLWSNPLSHFNYAYILN